MKKLTVLFLIFLLSSSFLLSQSRLSFGPTVSLSFSTFNGKDAQPAFGNLGSKTGFSIGGFMNYQFAEMFALQPEISYVMKGATSTSGGVSYTFNANYIEIPILMKVYIPLEQGNFKLNVYAGPAVGFNVASSVDATANGQSASQDLKNQTKGLDLGLAIGGGVTFNTFGTGAMDLSLRYTLGLTTIDSSGSNLTITNGIFAIVANYAFH